MVKRVGPYEIVRVLARGGMAVVYLAYQPALQRQIALKRLSLSAGDASLAQRFVDEAHVVARLDHPNIVTVHDFCEQDGEPYIAMEFVSGGSLRRRLGSLTLAQVLGVLDDMLSALEHAADHSITHRDLKPENVLVTPRGSVKIADFGIALAHDAVSRLTKTGTSLGTPAYMAPEQAGGTARPDPRTDLYALGVMAYEMLAGRLPFSADGPPLTVMYRHVHEPVPPLADVASEVPAPLAAWVEALLAKDPGERPQGAADARRGLEEIAVAALGPYWRRDSALGREPAAAGNGSLEVDGVRRPPRTPEPEPGSPPPPTTAEPGAQATALARTTAQPVARRPRALPLALAGGAAVAALALTVLALDGGEDDGTAGSGARAGAPFAFGGDRGTSVVVGLPGWTPQPTARRSGAVLLLRDGGAAAVLPPSAPTPAGRFGSAVASGDFDRDGFADLAVGASGARSEGAPGRPGTVTVFKGSAGGLARGGATAVAGPADHLPGGSASYGAALAAADLDRDGYGDLVVGAPGADPFPLEDGGSGTMQVLFGGPGGLTADRGRTIGRARGQDAGFGSLVAAGDVDGDGHVDVVEAAGDHASYCAGGPDGPRECRPMAGGGAAALAAADMTGDRLADVLLGVPEALDGGQRSGAVLVLRGTRSGPAREPTEIAQDAPHVPGNAQRDDRFGAALETGDLDRDGYEDVIVGAPGEDEEAGRITLVRGARRGYAISGNRGFGQEAPGIPGEPAAGDRFGAALALSLDAGRRATLTIAAPGEGRAGTLWTFPEVTASLASPDVGRVDLARVRGSGGSDPDVTLAGPGGG